MAQAVPGQPATHHATHIHVRNADGVQVGYERRPEVKSFIDTLVSKHAFVRSELVRVFARARFNETVARLINPVTAPPPANWHEYRANRVEPKRIAQGVAFWHEHAKDLVRAEQTYGVPQQIIIGILGIETYFGRNTGKFRVIDALTTLSFDYPNKDHDRSPFFRDQLEQYLLLARDQGFDVFGIRGSYAGAIGLPQFMPGSYRDFGVDFDGDGVVDLRGSPADAIGSVANYLAQHGWVRGLVAAYPAHLVAGTLNDELLARDIAAGSEPQLSIADLAKAGIQSDTPLGETARVALIDLPNASEATDYFVGTQNFHVLTLYNRSYYYAMAVIELGRAIGDEAGTHSTAP
jgi:membrane-bound lytic murein transglycosylase B